MWTVVLRRVLFIVAVWGAASLLAGFEAAASNEKKSILMERPGSSNAGGPTIDGGTKQDPNDWPATLKFEVDGRFACTSTIVGQRVIVTAAHCVTDGGTGVVRVASEGIENSIRCNQHPGFDSQSFLNDFALCISDKNFPSRFGYENIEATTSLFAAGTNLFLLGYGCRDVSDAKIQTKLASYTADRQKSPTFQIRLTIISKPKAAL